MSLSSAVACLAIGQPLGDNYFQPMARDEAPESLSLLLRESREGDERAMERLYERYKNGFFSLALRYTSNRVAAEDLLQDIFIKILSHIRDVENEETFVAWMYRIALNTCYSYLRGQRSAGRRAVSLSEVEGRKEEAVYNGHEESLSGHLEEAIRSLPERLRAVFVLHDVEGYKHREIARILGCTVGTSKSQLFKARLKMRQELRRKKLFEGGKP